MSIVYVVAVGKTTGMYTTEDEALAAALPHPLPLCIPATASQATALLQAFEGVHPTSVVYTDGACTGNGKPGSRAGVGVYWSDGDARNVSRRARGCQTNNVAELEAIEDALDAVLACPELASQPVVVVSDSHYSISCLTEWYHGFEARNWKTSAGGPVKNIELIRRAREKLLRTNVRLVHVRGHQGHAGNEKADLLAVAGKSL